jgi:hypothetical protein
MALLISFIPRDGRTSAVGGMLISLREEEDDVSYAVHRPGT